jgi:PleD family two-component response regulator
MNSKSLRILLVEDNAGDARLVKEMLKESNRFPFQIAHVTTQAQAVAYLEQETPDIVFLDLSLPDGHGLASAGRIIDRHRNLPIVILTGLDDESVGLEAVHRGAQDYLVKGQLDARLISRVILYSIERKLAELEKEKLINELQDLFTQVKTLRGLLPMCAWCKRIRDEQGEWVALENYIKQYSNADVTHGICPECAGKRHQKA